MARLGITNVASSVLYGGAVTFAEWWDADRISKGTLTKKDVLQKVGVWTYFIVGGFSAVALLAGWMRRYEEVEATLATCFMYDLPRVGKNIWNDMGGSGTGSSSAVQEAQRILQQRQAAHTQLAAAKQTSRTYEPEFNQVVNL